ncbi:MAG: nucleotidyltransferase domain-containing protein [Chloroflexi bacterium]|nr:nucleotidyltransferase domain-containing protein [Chloroflexota bacterium]
MEKKVVESKELKESKEFQEILVKHGVVLAYLFGSHAKGTARAFSDVDIAVLLPYDTPRSKFFDVRLALTDALMSLLGKNEIDVVVLNEATPLLAYQVVRYGKIVYEDKITSPSTSFIVRVIKYYADTEHFRKISLKYLNAAMYQYRSQRTAVALREKADG